MVPFFIAFIFNMLGITSPTNNSTTRDSLSDAGDPVANATSFFTEGEINICKQIYALREMIVQLALQLKESLIARGKLSRDTTYEQVTNDETFMQLISDLVHLNATDDMSQSIYGVVIVDGIRYEAVTDFFLANDTIKPRYYEQLCSSKKFPSQVLVKLKDNRRKLLEKHKSCVKDIIQGMNFEGTPKEQPKSATKKEVQERVQSVMVRVNFLSFFK